jgi:hypothetical protein
MYNWSKNIAQWRVKNTLYLSIVFTWDLPRAKEIAENPPKGIKKIVAGGPAVNLLPDYLKDVAEIQHETIYPALSFHNPMATFTTKGCPNKCSFCAVPKTEGNIRELDTWDARPIISDNNLLAASKSHFINVVDSVKRFPFVDFNGGLEASLFEPFHARILSDLKATKLTFAFDNINKGDDLVSAIAIANEHGLNDIRVYVLIGFEDDPNDAYHRLEKVRAWGAMPFPQRFQPLYALKKNDYIADKWTELELQSMSRYYSRLNWLGHIPYEEYEHVEYKKQGRLLK